MDFDTGLERGPANHQPLTPLLFLERAGAVFPDHLAVVHGPLRRTYRELRARCRQLASALTRRGIGRGDVVAALLPNIPEMVEAHYGVPMSGAVLNTINTRLDADTVAYILGHGEARAVIVDREFAPLLRAALAIAGTAPRPSSWRWTIPRRRRRRVPTRLAASSTRRCWRRATRISRGRCRATSGTRSRSTTPPARRGGRRAWCTTIAARSCWRRATCCRRGWGGIRPISGPCRCSTATAGASPGRSAPSPAPMSACARCGATRCGGSWPSTA